jgi:hypothetical protein
MRFPRRETSKRWPRPWRSYWIGRNKKNIKTRSSIHRVGFIWTHLILEKNILINRDNQILLNKLVEISHGKWVILNTNVSVLSPAEEENLGISECA